MKDFRPKTACRFSGNLPPYPKPKPTQWKGRDSPVSAPQRKSHVPPSLHLQALLKLKHKEVQGTSRTSTRAYGGCPSSASPSTRTPGRTFSASPMACSNRLPECSNFPVPSMLPTEALTVVLKSFDARKQVMC
ncbi:uncharacterized protein LOC126605215 [Malus sylvestris]|uniref:uncharacterized protein LOC126605215 n=1 Tax=Malus sylvestris TaxID=3752 RepID=UPI0021AC456E|nr:uncharacterized protein LOC126605215 [Malus sylvestris]